MLLSSFLDFDSKYFLEIGNFGISWYAFCILTGVILAVVMGVKEGKKFGINPTLITDGVLICVPLSILGARLYYVIFEWEQFYVEGDFGATFRHIIGLTDNGFQLAGLSITGGVIDTGTYQLEVANLPEGFTAKIVASDFEEIVNKAGKIANGFFIRNPELQIDFRKNAIILNKTPIHTAKTNHLKYLNKFGSEQIQNLINDSQLWMAEQTAKLHSQLNAQLWLVGYSELKEKKIFTAYRNELKETYLSLENKNSWDNVFVFQHFSMNRFSIDLNNFQKQNQSLSLQEAIKAIGILHKNEIFM